MKRRHLVLPLVLFPFAKAEASDNIDWGRYIVTAFEQLGSDLSAVRRKASGYTSTASWRRVSDFDVTAAGAGACAIPVAGYATLPAEFAYLMRQVYDSAMGVGFILNGSATKADFANILAHWTGELALDDTTLTKAYEVSEAVASELAETAGEEAIQKAVDKLTSRSAGGTADAHLRAQSSGGGTGAARANQPPSHHVASNVIAQKAGTKSAGKIAPKVAAKAGAKISAKYAAKAALAWVPILSALVCGGVNWWIMDSIVTSAEEYFSALGRVRRRRYGTGAAANQYQVVPAPASKELVKSHLEQAYLLNVDSVARTMAAASTGSTAEVEAAAKAAGRGYDMADFAKSIIRDRKAARALNDKGMSLFGQLGPDRASSEYKSLLNVQQSAFELDPLDVEIASNFAIYLFNAGELQKAVKYIVYAFSLPRPPESTGRTVDWTTLSAVLAVQGDRTNAANALFVTLALSSDIKRRCEAAILATQRTYGQRHRQATEDMLARVREKQLSEDPACGAPVAW